MAAKIEIFLSAALASVFLSYSCVGIQSETAMNARSDTATVEKLPMEEDGIVRLSRIEVFAEYLDEYLKYAAEVGEISLLTEPGVLTMYSLQDKENPCSITIIETYASHKAYVSHIGSAHFRRYKQETLHMVRQLELRDQIPLKPASRIENYIERKK